MEVPVLQPPEDFGMDALGTLCHVSPRAPSRLHSTFWAAWRRAVFSHEAELIPRGGPGAMDPSDAGASHELMSVTPTARVPVGALLLEPAKASHAGLVVVHTSEPVEPLERQAERYRRAVERGLTVLLLRVRGFGGSRGAWSRLRSDDADYAVYGLVAGTPREADMHHWVLPQCVADVTHACLALRRRLSARSGCVPTISMDGTSFGAALVIMAAGQMTAHHPELEPSRLTLALPSLGDLAWRFADESRVARMGMARAMFEHLRRTGEAGADMLDAMRLVDSAVHSVEVRSSVLMRLALRDDRVPAPTQAGVFNNLSTSVGRKWRFVTPTGHFEGGLRDLRRAALFERLREEFWDPARPVDQILEPWEGLLLEGERAPN